ncbi:Disease resistance protein [Nymphaea thermarum]|nr:Disease resistance protein [Nymphaea thermarum]
MAPPEEYFRFSKQAVALCHGLPKALEKLGSFLYDKTSEDEWDDMLNKLKQSPPNAILDLVFSARTRNKMATNGKGKKLGDAVGESRPSTLTKFDVIVSFSGGEVAIDAFTDLLYSALLRDGISACRSNGGDDAPEKERLREAPDGLGICVLILSVSYAASERCLTELGWMMEQRRLIFPVFFDVNPSDVRRQKGALERPFRRHDERLDREMVSGWKKALEEVGGTKGYDLTVIGKIKVLNLRECRQLIVTPNFSRHPGLVKLVLEKCQSLVKIHKSIVVLKDLVSLKLRGCTSLEKVPKEICSLHKLKFLDIANCGKVNKLPRNLGKMESLLELHIDGTAIKEVPASMLLLKSLSHLSLNSCWLLKNLPDAIGELISLKELELDGTEVDKIPSSVGSLKKLEKLSARQCKCLSILPHSIGDAKNLKMLLLDGTIIEQLPDSVGSLENLNRLTLKKCKQLKHLPVSMGQLKALNHLYLPETSITELSEDFGMLSRLTILDMKKCECIKELPTTFGGLKELKNLCLRSNSMLTMLPTSFSLLSSLKELDASRCNLMESAIPNDFGNLTSLVSLKLGYNKFCSLPNSMRNLTQLKDLYVENCTELRSLLHLPSSLVHLDAKHCVSLNSICDLSDMENLEELALTNCSKLEDVIGLENLKALRFLYMDCCRHLRDACKSRLAKGIFENLKYFSIPGNDIPRCLMYNQSFCEIPKLSTSTIKIKGLILCFVYAIIEEPANGYPDIPGIVDIQIMIMVDGKEIFRSTLIIHGIPKPNENQIYYCHYNERDKVALFLEDGGRIEVLKRSKPYIEAIVSSANSARYPKCRLCLLKINFRTVVGCPSKLTVFKNLWLPDAISKKSANWWSCSQEEDDSFGPMVDQIRGQSKQRRRFEDPPNSWFPPAERSLFRKKSGGVPTGHVLKTLRTR